MFKSARYESLESHRALMEWWGATCVAFSENPFVNQGPNVFASLLRAQGALTQRSFARLTVKPDWDLGTLRLGKKQHTVDLVVLDSDPFGDLVRFDLDPRAKMGHQALVVAPMSGHHATLLRAMVKSLLPDMTVCVTDWRDARHVAVDAGRFDVEDQVRLLARWMEKVGPDTVVFAVCQPVPVVLAATALLKREGKALPKALILMGGPVDPDANPTDVTDFGRRVTMGELEHAVITRVSARHEGVGRLVYPGAQQLAMFVSMNATVHARAFGEKIWRDAFGDGHDHDRHNRFYDEYLAVMDMPAEFYLSTVERIFKRREIARNRFCVGDDFVDITAIEGISVMVIEGGEDDISAPGQCLAAFDLLPKLPASQKVHCLHPTAGHYGIFAGRAWREDILPDVLSFVENLKA